MASQRSVQHPEDVAIPLQIVHGTDHRHWVDLAGRPLVESGG